MKNKILACILVMTLALGMAFILASCNAEKGKEQDGSTNTGDGKNEVLRDPPPKGVKGITTSKQKVNNRSITNYQVTITNDISWSNLSKQDKQVIVDYVFKEVLRLNAENKIAECNILGVQEGTGEVLFILDKDYGEMIAYKSGVEEYRFPAPFGF